MRALTRELGHDNSFPHGMTATVLEIEHVVMNDDVRKRFRYMAHLPSHCDLFLVGVDLTGIISPDTQNHFQAEFKKRERAPLKCVLCCSWRNDAHYPQLHNVAVGAPPDDDGTDELERSDATDESPYNSPFASVTTNQGYDPAFNLGGQDDTAAASPGWPNVGSAMAVLFN
ncbi:hypothetical protein DYB32_009563 [Aphanomyces invadans]|uniref:Uncharacterized protein n=1 Tax=Aphanomyces invadans TaxID=157072 RepID=A0A418AI38_9STRA|nr:hypothetical protein DYB32_009563 [Aphanomyces invadans]